MSPRLWWRVSCEELGPDHDESVLAPTAEQAATSWAEGRGTDADASLLVTVYAEAGCSGALMGEPSRFELAASVRWTAKAVS